MLCYTKEQIVCVPRKHEQQSREGVPFYDAANLSGVRPGDETCPLLQCMQILGEGPGVYECNLLSE